MPSKEKRYLTKEEEKRLKEVEIELLDELDRVCKLLNIKYYMVGGTLLGAVRHKGFIPWDDDIDVVMFRKDLGLLEKEGIHLFDKKYFLQTENTDKYYPLMTSKLRKNNTVFLEECMSSHVKSHKGIFIDIFPLDDISDVNNEKIKRHVKYMKIITTILCEKTGYHFDVKWYTKLLSYMIGLIGINNLKKIRNYLMTYENDNGFNYSTIYASNYGFIKQFRNKEIYGDGIRIRFENGEYLAPIRYIDFLVQLFGENYMDLPPIEKRVTRHPIKEIRFNGE